MCSNKKPQDHLTEAIGSIGLWQIWICFIVFLVRLPAPWHQLGITFLAPATTFQCVDTAPNPEAIETFDSVCLSNCSRYEYDRSLFAETIITDFDLICDDSWLKDFNQTAVMLGILVGSALFGFLSDRYGRRLPFIISVIIMFISGVGSSFCGDYIVYTALRFITGCASGGSLVTSFVIVMETVGAEYREAVGSLYQMPFIVGHLIMSAFGYFCRTWQSYQLAVSIPVVVFISYIWILPESPRWLISVGKKDEATKILTKAAKWNKLPHQNMGKLVDSMVERAANLKHVEDKKANLLDLFRHSAVRKRSICVCIMWAACSCCFYGVSQYISLIGGNIFANVAISAAIQIPGNVLAIFLIKYIGRKITTIVCTFLSACSMLAIAALPEAEWLSILLSTLGILFITMGFASVYIYTSELFPTVVRNMGVGLGSTSARVGSMVAPFIATSSSVRWVAPVVFGILPLTAGAACLLLPETKGENLMDQLEDCEKS